MARLQGALDTEIHIAVQRFLSDGVAADPSSLYIAIQKSNSSLKRKPKKLLQASIERVLDFIGVDSSSDSEKETEVKQAQRPSDLDAMNRSLRAGLASPQPQHAEANKKRQRMGNGEPPLKRSKTDGATTATVNETSLIDIGGMDKVVGQLKKLLVWPLLFSDRFTSMRVKIPNGVLLHGPPGCGKTMLTRAFASDMGLPFVEILGPSIVSGMSGESEKAIREKFDEAKKLAPCLVFMDEIDAIAPKRESSQSQMEKRIVAQLLVCMDELERDTSKPVIVLATTNRPDSLDPALRRGGRFSTEINIGVPNEQTRESILRAQTREMPLADGIDFKKLSKMTAGYVGADLHDLVGKAGFWQLSQYFDALEAQMLSEANGTVDHNAENETESVMRLIARHKRDDLPEPPGYETMTLTMEAFLHVLPDITPSSKREGFATVPDVSWNDIGALQDVRDELQTAIVQPIKHPEQYRALGITSPTGVLLWGPPGCGKTLLAKAVAAESKANFISVKGPELLDKFVGESEAAVRRIFSRARSSVPCVIFFDELDALVPRRDGSGSEASARVVNTLLSELDGLNDRAGIYVIGATNRPDMIDAAMLREGRFGTPLFVDLPGENERAEILSTLVRGKPVQDLEKIAELARSDLCKGYSGADMGGLLRVAGQHTISRGGSAISVDDFREGTKKVRGSVRDVQRYHDLRANFER